MTGWNKVRLEIEGEKGQFIYTDEQGVDKVIGGFTGRLEGAIDLLAFPYRFPDVPVEIIRECGARIQQMPPPDTIPASVQAAIESFSLVLAEVEKMW